MISSDSNNNNVGDSNSSIDSDIDGNDEETITFSAIRSLEASYRGKCYRVYHLDLDEDEFDTLLPVHTTNVSLEISNRDIHTDGDELSIKRISIDSTATSIQCAYNEALSQQTQTDRILFSESEPLLAKYDDSIYIVGKQLKEEYKKLLQRSKCPMGTPIRIKKDRLEISYYEHTINVRPSRTQFRRDQEVIILKPPCDNDSVAESNTKNAESDNDDDDEYEENELILNRYLCNECGELYPIERKLLFSDWNGYYTELYAEPDVKFNKDGELCKVNVLIFLETCMI